MSTTTTSCVRLRHRGLTIFVTEDGELHDDAPAVTGEMLRHAAHEREELLDWLTGDDDSTGLGGDAQLLAGSTGDRPAWFAVSPAGFRPPGEGQSRPEAVSQL